jgi:drug/metabolite transporter (DMT)-like permease
MIAVLLGLFAALCFSIHDLIARRYAPVYGPYRMSAWVMVVGAVLLLGPVLYRSTILQGDAVSFAYAACLGIAYAFAIGGILIAYSLAPVSVVGPLTAWYPALVVLWGLVLGLTPSLVEWAAIGIILVGALVVARTGHDDGGFKSVAAENVVRVVIACLVACLGFAAAVVLGQAASERLGEFETTFLSRFPAILLLLPLALKERTDNAQRFDSPAWVGVFAMGLVDILAMTAINWAGRFDNKEFASMGISAYGALTVLLAMIFLRERVSAGQWAGIALITIGVGILGWPT